MQKQEGNGPIELRAIGQWKLPQIGTSNLNYHGILMHIASDSNFHGLRGSSGLQMTSEVKADLRIGLSDLNYPGIYVHVASGGHFSGV